LPDLDKRFHIHVAAKTKRAKTGQRGGTACSEECRDKLALRGVRGEMGVQVVRLCRMHANVPNRDDDIDNAYLSLRFSIIARAITDIFSDPKAHGMVAQYLWDDAWDYLSTDRLNEDARWVGLDPVFIREVISDGMKITSFEELNGMWPYPTKYEKARKCHPG
jgi:hypothetical protein